VKNVCTKRNVYPLKGKHDTWLARELTTYKYENESLKIPKGSYKIEGQSIK
jgi:hypothetical protein